MLLMGGGVFLVLLFLHWLFLEPKNFGLSGERFFSEHGVWFYAVASLIPRRSCLVRAGRRADRRLRRGHRVKGLFHHPRVQALPRSRKQSLGSGGRRSDISKMFYLEVMDVTFSIDGVLGAFAFTLSVPLIFSATAWVRLS